MNNCSYPSASNLSNKNRQSSLAMAPATETVDVVVVGAGISGLRAASLLVEAGLTVAVLEATDRVGGKILSVDAEAAPAAAPDGSPRNGGKLELGAAWINDTNQAEMYKLAQEFGFDLIEQRATGLDINEVPGSGYVSLPYGGGADDEASVAAAMAESAERNVAMMLYQDVETHDVEAPCDGPKSAALDGMTFREYVTAGGGAEYSHAVAAHLSTGFLGCEPNEISALCMIDYLRSGTGIANMASDLKDGGQYLRNRHGNQAFCTRLAEKLPTGALHLANPVTRIVQVDAQQIRVETATNEVFSARKVVLSIPSTLYSSIAFHPPLPADKRALGEESVQGYYSKTVFVYPAPWWREAGLSGRLSAETGPISFTRDTCSDADGQYSITCFHTGDRGREWSKYSAAERRRQVREQVDKTIGEAARTAGVSVPEPSRVFEMEWSKEKYFGGAPCPYTLPGTMIGAGKCVREAVGDVHFIGTETATVWKGYMEGAVRSGIRGAEEVVKALQ